MELTEDQFSKLISLVNQGLDQLYERDIFLLDNRVHERAIAFRFALYFSELIKGTEFDGLDLDFEYNKREDDYKTTPSRPNGSYPDLILHRRGIQDQNVLIIEFKCAWNSSSRSGDIEKLQEYTLQNLENGYYYGLGIFLEFVGERDEVRIFQFVNGERNE